MYRAFAIGLATLAPAACGGICMLCAHPKFITDRKVEMRPA